MYDWSSCAERTAFVHLTEIYSIRFNRYKVDASIYDSAMSHTRRSEASEKREDNSVSTFGRFRLWTSIESLSVSVKL